MDPVLSALLRSWEWRADVIGALVVSGTMYVLGWKRLRTVTLGCTGRSPGSLAGGWRLASYLGGLLIIAVALLSPVDVLGGQLFFVHMIQHLLLVMCAPPLLLLSNPFPVVLWGLPRGVRRAIGPLFYREAGFRRAFAQLTRPGLIWFFFVIIYVGWHDPGAYDAALRSDRIHDLEHLSFFAAALFFWWHVTAAGPRMHRRFLYEWRIAYLLLTVPVNMLTGVAITFSSEPIYRYYLDVPRPWGLTMMQDQMLGGVIMWIPGSMMFLIAVLVIVARMLAQQERRARHVPVAAPR